MGWFGNVYNELDIPHRSAKEINQVQELVDEETVMKFQVQENSMLENSIIYNDESIRRLLDLSSFDQ